MIFLRFCGIIKLENKSFTHRNGEKIMPTLRTQNTTTIKADVYPAAITQLIGVILAKSIHELKLFKSVRKLVKQVA